MYVNNQRSFTCDLCDGTLACALNEICERLIALEREPTEAEIPEFHPGRDCLSVEEAAEAFGARDTHGSRVVSTWADPCAQSSQ
jgi:hypothetical protein